MIPWLGSWWPVPPLDRKTRQFLIALMMYQPLEFRIALLSYQIKRMFHVEV